MTTFKELSSLSGRKALITGASGGLGKVFAETLGELGANLILVDLPGTSLEDLALKIKEKWKVKVNYWEIDLEIEKQRKNLIDNVIKEYDQLNVLVNNAGNAHGLDPIQTGDLDDWDAMIDINLKGLLYVSRAIIPNMVARESGHIINIGSTAAKEVYPNGNVYCATKHAVDSLNQAMRIDLNPYGIRVGAIHPGMVDTEFSTVRFKGDTEKAANVYKGFSPLQAEDLADIIHFVVSRPYHVNIADLVVMPTAQAMVSIVKRNL